MLRKELKDTGNAAAGDTGTSLKSRLMSLGSTAGVISGLGDMMGTFNKDASMGARIMSGFSLATGLLEAPMAGAIAGVGGLASGVAAAGLGVGVFGIVAKAGLYEGLGRADGPDGGADGVQQGDDGEGAGVGAGGRAAGDGRADRLPEAVRWRAHDQQERVEQLRQRRLTGGDRRDGRRPPAAAPGPVAKKPFLD